MSRAPYARAALRHGGRLRAGYGTAHSTVDPIHPANALICDLELAPRNRAGLVESPPIYPSCSGRCQTGERPLHRRTAEPRPPARRAMMNCAPPVHPSARKRIRRSLHVCPGRGSLRRMAIGRLPTRELLCLAAPLAMEGQAISGETMVEIRPSERGSAPSRDRIHRPLPAAPGEQLDARLLVRARRTARTSHTTLMLGASHARPPRGCGAIRETSGFRTASSRGAFSARYTTDRAPWLVSGFLAARDVASFLRHASGTNPGRDGFRASSSTASHRPPGCSGIS